MKKNLLLSLILVGGLSVTAFLCNSINEKRVAEVQSQPEVRSKANLAIEGRVVKEYVIKIKISKEVLEILRG